MQHHSHASQKKQLPLLPCTSAPAPAPAPDGSELTAMELEEAQAGEPGRKRETCQPPPTADLAPQPGTGPGGLGDMVTLNLICSFDQTC